MCKCVCVCMCVCVIGESSMDSFTDQHHGQQPGSSVAVLMEEQARTTGGQLQLFFCGDAQLVEKG